MAIIKSYTDLEQAKKLTEILPLESADMCYIQDLLAGGKYGEYKPYIGDLIPAYGQDKIRCWSLAALLKYISEIKSQVYTPVLFPSEGKWVLQFAEHGHGNVCDVSCDNSVDACYEMILKLNKLNLL